MQVIRWMSGAARFVGCSSRYGLSESEVSYARTRFGTVRLGSYADRRAGEEGQQ